MSGKTSWTVKGIDPAARELAKRQARKAGLTIGAWLNETIQNSERPDKADAASDIAKDARVDVEALASRLELLEARLAETAGGIERGLQNVEMSVVSGFAEMDRRLVAARQQGRESPESTSRQRVVEARRAPPRRRPMALVSAASLCLLLGIGVVFFKAYAPGEAERLADAVFAVVPTPGDVDDEAGASGVADPAELARLEPAAGPGAIDASGSAPESAELPYQQALKLLSGEDGAADPAQAEKLLEAAARQGHSPAQLKLAERYLQDNRSDADSERGLFWLMKAAAAGEADAEYRLALLYAAGERVARNYRQAVTWFHRAADGGHVDAQYNLGLLYLRGMGVKRDVQIAHEWFSVAADNGDREAGRKRDELALLLTATRGGLGSDAFASGSSTAVTDWKSGPRQLGSEATGDGTVLRELTPLLGSRPGQTSMGGLLPAVDHRQ